LKDVRMESEKVRKEGRGARWQRGSRVDVRDLESERVKKGEGEVGRGSDNGRGLGGHTTKNLVWEEKEEREAERREERGESSRWP
jgi:hypothetical protein